MAASFDRLGQRLDEFGERITQGHDQQADQWQGIERAVGRMNDRFDRVTDSMAQAIDSIQSAPAQSAPAAPATRGAKRSGAAAEDAGAVEAAPGRLADSLKLQNLIENLGHTLDDRLAKLGESLKQSVAQDQDQRQAERQRYEQHLDQVEAREAEHWESLMQQMRDELAQRTDAVAQHWGQIAERFTGQLDERLEAFGQLQSQEAQRWREAVDQITADLRERFETMLAGLGEAATQSAQRADALAASIDAMVQQYETGAQTLGQRVQGAGEAMDQVVDQFREGLTQTIAELRAALEQLAAPIETANTATERVQAAADQHAQTLATLNETTEKLGATHEQQMQASGEKIERFAGSFEQAAEKSQAMMAQLDALAERARLHSEQLEENYTQQLAERFAALAQEAERVHALTEAFHEMRQKMEDSTGPLIEFRQAVDDLPERLDQFETSLTRVHRVFGLLGVNRGARVKTPSNGD